MQQEQEQRQQGPRAVEQQQPLEQQLLGPVTLAGGLEEALAALTAAQAAETMKHCRCTSSRHAARLGRGQQMRECEELVRDGAVRRRCEREEEQECCRRAACPL